MDPVIKDYKLYKGCQFKIQFSLYNDLNSAINTVGEEVEFLAAASPSGEAVISRNTNSETAPITIDTTQDYLHTLELSELETSALEISGKLHYEINYIETSGYKQRWQMGVIYLYNSIQPAAE